MERYIYEEFVRILKEELVPATGCTEPIAVAYAGAVVRRTLGLMPERVHIKVSPCIVKNVKSVVVPNTNGRRGIEAAAAAGIAAGDPDRGLEVLARVTDEDLARMDDYLEKASFTVALSDHDYIFDIRIEAEAEGHEACVQIAGFHTNIIFISKDGGVLFQKDYEETESPYQTDRTLLTVDRIVTFADEAAMEDVREIIERQIECNTAIAMEGLRHDWGANVGRTLLEAGGSDAAVRAKAYAAAGSDARMNGCEMPVVINSGSGNQGLASSLPVIVYAEEWNRPREALIRALVVSALVTIHMKNGVGSLSAFCGATCAGCGAAAGIVYLHGGGKTQIKQTVSNAAAINSGMICDGAKSSCAAKISSSVEAGLLSMQMAGTGNVFAAGDGILGSDIEKTVENVGRVARNGMTGTGEEIMRIMFEE